MDESHIAIGKRMNKCLLSAIQVIAIVLACNYCCNAQKLTASDLITIAKCKHENCISAIVTPRLFGYDRAENKRTGMNYVFKSKEENYNGTDYLRDIVVCSISEKKEACVAYRTINDNTYSEIVSQFEMLGFKIVSNTQEYKKSISEYKSEYFKEYSVSVSVSYNEVISPIYDFIVQK